MRRGRACVIDRHHRRTRSFCPRLLANVAVIVAAACTDKAAPSSPSPSPDLAARLTVTIDTLGSAVAIPSVSSVRFDASGSGPSTGPLQYSIDYGDRTVSSERISEHVYEAPGTYEVTLTVSDAGGRRASASQSITVRAVAGSWFHFAYNPSSSRPELRRLTIASQSGRSVSGELSGPQGVPVPVTGTLEGDRTLRLIGMNTTITGPVPSQVIADGALFHLSGLPGTSGEPLPFVPITSAPVGPGPVARLHIQIDSLGSVAAIHKFSPIRFSAEGSEADSPRYVIELGDGAYTTAASEIHPCGNYTSRYEGRVTLVDRFGRMAAVSRFFPCINLREPAYPFYGWSNTIYNPATRREERRTILIEFQDGATVSGYYVHPEGNRSRFSGTLSGDRSIRLLLDGGGIEFTGEVVVEDSSTELSYFQKRHMTLTLKGGSADGMTLRFVFTCGTYC